VESDLRIEETKKQAMEEAKEQRPIAEALSCGVSRGFF